MSIPTLRGLPYGAASSFVRGCAAAPDIVEYNPSLDASGLTAVVTATLGKEVVASMHTSDLAF